MSNGSLKPNSSMERTPIAKHELALSPLGRRPMRAIWFVLWLTTPPAVWGQAADSTEDPLFESVTGSFFALSVADVASSSQWYSENLGLEVVMEVPKGDGQPGVIVFVGGGLIVELIVHDQASPLTSIASDRNAESF